MAQKSPPAKQRVQLTMTSDLYDIYEAKGRVSKRSAEDEMLARLTTCRDHTSSTALYIDDSTRMALEAVAGRPLRSGGDILGWARTLATLTVAGVVVPLSEQLMKRLDSRRFGATMPEYVSRTTVDLLEKEVGMR